MRSRRTRKGRTIRKRALGSTAGGKNSREGLPDLAPLRSAQLRKLGARVERECRVSFGRTAPEACPSAR